MLHSRAVLRLLLILTPIVILAFCTVPFGFLSGNGEYWQYVISDRAQSLTGYLYYIAQPWEKPFLHLRDLSIPAGMLLINSDSIPLLALLGKAIHTLTGSTTTPYGFWYLFCWVMNGATAALVLWRAGMRDTITLGALALLTACMPFWFARWYHFSLIAHFLILLSFDAYLLATRKRWLWAQIQFALLAVLAALIHIYLWCMVIMVMAASIQYLPFNPERLQRGSLLKATMGIRIGLLCGSVAVASVFAMGYFSLTGSSENGGYTHFSTNLLSPFYSNHSAFSPHAWSLLELAREERNAWPFFFGQRPDATGGQYLEGMAYLGAGAWLLILVALWVTPRSMLQGALRRHFLLLGILGIALLLAVTPHLSFGSIRWPLWTPPEKLMSLLGSVRASGRFFWLVGYFAILSSALALYRYAPPRLTASVLIGAAVLQVFDTTPLRQAIQLDASTSAKVLSAEHWQRSLKKADVLYIIPSYECGHSDLGNFKSFIQVLAARSGPIPTNSASQSRMTIDCKAEYALLDSARSTPENVLYVFFDNDGDRSRIDQFITLHGSACTRFEVGVTCAPVR
jgi:Family of unknown function (DUF6311)